ncbi:MAG: hypothetical protein C4533_04630 [Candidatus Omnitrophota bacterium]|nr:MAG: hypothetical protein C4533_04630 [Candidatus Omnitrophota bacterium]
MAQTIDNMIVSRIYGRHRGWVFTPMHFLDLGSRMAVDQTLGRLTKAGIIRRLTRGLYDYPVKHPDFGDLPPNYDRVAQALVGRDNLKIQPSGAYAANLLGLTEQVPAKIVFFTDGPNRKVQIGKQTIVLKRTTPRNMATAGRISGLVIQALRYLKQGNIDSTVVAKLKRRLSDADKNILMNDIRYAPAWIGDIFRKIQG